MTKWEIFTIVFGVIVMAVFMVLLYVGPSESLIW